MLDYKLTRIFPKPTINAGYIILALGVILGFLLEWAALLLVPLGYFIALSFNGIEINPKIKTFRSYSNIFGLKFGKWESLEDYPDLCVMLRKDSYRAYSYSMSSMTDSNNYYGLFLLSKNHRKKLEIQRHGESQAAIEAAKKLAELLNLNYVKYQPATASKGLQSRRGRH